MRAMRTACRERACCCTVTVTPPSLALAARGGEQTQATASKAYGTNKKNEGAACRTMTRKRQQVKDV